MSAATRHDATLSPHSKLNETIRDEMTAPITIKARAPIDCSVAIHLFTSLFRSLIWQSHSMPLGGGRHVRPSESVSLTPSLRLLAPSASCAPARSSTMRSDRIGSEQQLVTALFLRRHESIGSANNAITTRRRGAGHVILDVSESNSYNDVFEQRT